MRLLMVRRQLNKVTESGSKDELPLRVEQLQELTTL